MKKEERKIKDQKTKTKNEKIEIKKIQKTRKIKN